MVFKKETMKGYLKASWREGNVGLGLEPLGAIDVAKPLEKPSKNPQLHLVKAWAKIGQQI